MAEGSLESWDRDTWAENIIRQGFTQDSHPRLQRRISEFLVRASAADREELETGRARLLESMKSAQAEQVTRYPAADDESKQTRRQKAQTKIRAGCRAFSEVTYEYSKIMDTLANQAPEYVSLAWGAMKIILVTQINHEELKQKVKQCMEQIKLKFEMIDHLTELVPRANLVAAVAKAYELFSRFLAKAVKYYAMNMSKARMTAFFKPWKLNLQSLADAIDQAFADIKDISHFHGFLESHASLDLGERNLRNTEQTMKMQEQSLERLSVLEQMMHEFKGMIVGFSKDGDVQQVANLLRQHVDEILQEPKASRKSHKIDEAIHERAEATNATSGSDEVTDARSFLDNLFVELRGFRQDSSRREMAIGQASEMRGHRSKQKNITRIEGVMEWIESETSRLLWINGHNLLRRSIFTMSFAAPLLVLGESNYETTLVLRHFCGDDLASKPQDYLLLVQALLYQILQQNPKILDSKKSALTRGATNTLTTLWDLLLDCIAEVNADCTFIIIENIDVLKGGPSSNVDEEKFILQHLEALVQDLTKLIKVLLVASLARDQASSSQGRSALMLTQRREPMGIHQDELALVPHKLIEMQHKTCRSVRFDEINMLYIPNTTVYTFEDDELRAFVVVELSGMELRYFESYNPLQIRVWSIDHDGQNVVRRYHDLTVRQFSGQKDIKDLQYIPAGYLPDESEKRKSLIVRGKLWWTFSFGTHHVTTDRYKTQAIVDQRSLVGNGDLSEFTPVFEALLAKDSDSLKPLYYLLCPPLIDAFILQEQKQTTVKVCNIRTHQYNTRAFDDLVLADDSIVPQLQAVCESRMMVAASKVNEQSTGDLARRKENALVILLHGEPGVGKTFASECAAESAKRPLLPVSFTDMSAGAKGFEKALRDAFTLAESWNAIVVLHEANIHLSIDSQIIALLRALKQFHGILILQSVDDSMFRNTIQGQSLLTCIHLSIRFDSLREDQRSKLSDQLLRVLERDYENIEIKVRQQFGYFFRKVDWSCKEIRNILQTAIAFAEKEASDRSSFYLGESVSLKQEQMRKTELWPKHLLKAIKLSPKYKNLSLEDKEAIENRTW